MWSFTLLFSRKSGIIYISRGTQPLYLLMWPLWFAYYIWLPNIEWKAKGWPNSQISTKETKAKPNKRQLRVQKTCICYGRSFENQNVQIKARFTPLPAISSQVVARMYTHRATVEKHIRKKYNASMEDSIPSSKWRPGTIREDLYPPHSFVQHFCLRLFGLLSPSSPERRPKELPFKAIRNAVGCKASKNLHSKSSCST